MDDQPSRQSSPIMHDKPIAEIIGWDRNEGPGYTYWTRPGKADGAPPTVDDLLAWLAAPEGDGWYVQAWNNGQPYNVAPLDRKWEVCRAKSGHGQQRWTGPSLLAALESAVRAVAGDA